MPDGSMMTTASGWSVEQVVGALEGIRLLMSNTIIQTDLEKETKF